MTDWIDLTRRRRRRSKMLIMGNKIDWDYCEIPTTSKKERGGKLDSIFKFISFGLLGIETTTITPDILVRRTLSGEIPGKKSIELGKLALKIKKPIAVYDFKKFNSPEIKSRVVLNKKS